MILSELSTQPEVLARPTNGTSGLAEAIEWPAGCVSDQCLRGLVTTAQFNVHLTWIGAVCGVINAVATVLFSQALIALGRRRSARDAAKHMHSALLYISHEARSPLNGAVLSLTLLDGIINSASPGAGWEEAPGLVGDLHASVEAAKRQLDDILTFERVTSTSAAKAVPWGWCRVAGSELRRLRSSFAGVCRAERIQLQFRGVQATPAGAAQASCGGTNASSLDPNEPPGKRLSLLAEELHQRQRSRRASVTSIASVLSGTSDEGIEAAETGQGDEVVAVDALIDGFVETGVAGHNPPHRIGWNTTGCDSKVERRPSAVARSSPAVRLSMTLAGPGRLLPAAPAGPLGSAMQEGRSLSSQCSRGVLSEPGIDVTDRGSAHIVGMDAGLTVGHAEPSFDAIADWEVFCDVDRLMTVIGSVLSNSVKYVPTSGTGQVTVSVVLGPESVMPGRAPARVPSHSRGGGLVRQCQRCFTGQGSARERRSSDVAPALPGKPGAQPMGGGGMAGSRAHRPESRVLVVEVLDNGCGIAPDRLRSDELFRPFQQLRMGDGMLSMAAGGLGLSTVRAIVVDQMGGDVGLSSREGEGTLFTARVPVWARRVGHPDAKSELAELWGAVADGGVTPSPVAGAAAGLKAVASAAMRVDGPSSRQGSRASGEARRSVAIDSGRSSSTSDWTAQEGHSHGEEVSPSAQPAASSGSRESQSSVAVPGAVSQSTRSAVQLRSRADREKRRRNRQAQRDAKTAASDSDGAVRAAVTPSICPVVWVVDDVAVARRSVARALRAWGLDVREIEDGRDMVDAVEALLRHAPGDDTRSSPPAGWPCAIVLDSRMPRLGGAAALREARGLVSSSGCGWGLVAIGATGSGPGSSEASELESSGASCVLGKPILPGELAGALVRSVQGVALPPRVLRVAGIR